MNDIDTESYVLAWETEDGAFLRTLANRTCRFVRTRVASNPHTPTDVLEVLSEDIDGAVRAGVASNKNASTMLLLRMTEKEFHFSEKAEIVLAALCANPNTPASSLEYLFHAASCWCVHIALVNNPRTPEKILEQLAKLPVESTPNLTDKNKDVRDIAKELLGQILPPVE